MYTINTITVYKYISSVAIFLYLFVAIVVVIKNRRSSLSRKFFNFCILFAVYNFAVLMLFLVSNPETARYFSMLCSLTGTPIPVFWYMFLRKIADANYVSIPYRLKNVIKEPFQFRKIWQQSCDRWLIVYVIVDILLIVSSVYLHQNVPMKKHVYWYYTMNSFWERPWVPFFGVFFFVVVGHALYHVRQVSKNATHIKKRFFRELYFFSGACAFLGILDTVFLSCGAGLFPPSPLFGIFYICFLFFSLIRYRFIMIEYDANNFESFFWALILIAGFSIVIYSVLASLIQDTGFKIIASILYFIFIAFIITKYLWPEKIYVLPNRFNSEGHDNFRDLSTFDEVKKTIKEIVEDDFASKNVRICISNHIIKDKKELKKIFQKEEISDTELNAIKGIVTYLSKKRGILDRVGFLNSMKNDERKELIQKMELLSAELIVPIYNRTKKLIGLIIFEERKIGIPYSISDIAKLENLSEIVSIAIEKARLLEHQSKMLEDASHELKTPLTTIRTYAQFIKSRNQFKEVSSSKSLDMILKENERHEALINNLIDISRLRGGTDLTLNREKFDLNNVITDALDIFSLQIQSKKIISTFNSQNNLPKIEGDKDKIKQVMINFISNSIKYTPKGGKIEIILAPKSHLSNNSYVKVSVKDTGVGVPKKEILKLFYEKYYRSKNARQTGAGGTGLGLIVSRHIIEVHNGRIGVKSKEGKGSAFWFTLPFQNKV